MVARASSRVNQLAPVLPLQVISEYNKRSYFCIKDMGMTAPLPAGLQQAADYIKAGQLQQAQPLLVKYIKQQPDSADAWYLMSFVVPQASQQIDCLQRVLRYNPAHRQAQARLVEVMTGQPAQPEPKPKPAPAAPVVEERPSPVETVPVPVQQPEAAPEPKPTGKSRRKSAPAKAAAPTTEPASSEFDTLRSKLSQPVEEYRKPRRSYKWLLGLLTLVVLLAAGGTAWVLLNRPAADDATVVIVPTAVPSPTDTPTVTPTPSVTPTRFPPTWTPTAFPTARPTRTPTPLPTLGAEAGERFASVGQAVADLRGLATNDQPRRYLLPPDQIETVVTNVLNANGLLSALPERARVLSVLGLIDPAYNLVPHTLNMHLDLTGSFYSPWTRQLYIVGGGATGLQRLAYAVESTRALLDATFGFENNEAYPNCATNTQQCQAVRALIAGDANLAAQQWLRQSASAQDRNEVQAARMPDLPLSDETAPLFVIRDVQFARDAGTAFVQALYQRGGWARVNDAYDALPQSTEQILHPDKYLAGEQPIEVAAVPLTEALGADWQIIADDVLGEWHTDLLLSASVNDQWRIPAEAARSAARGWGGDRSQVFYNASASETALAAAWTWDSVADAREFTLALSAYLDLRFNNAKTPVTDGNCWQSAQEAACLYTRDQNTLWLLAPRQSQVDALKAAHLAFP